MQFIITTLCLSLLTSAMGAVLDSRGGTPLAQAVAAQRLEAAGIKERSSGDCTVKTNRHCTSYEGLLSGTVQGIIDFKNACGPSCSITITGGTEVGHAPGADSHGTG